MEPGQAIDVYLRARRKRDALRRVIECDDPAAVERLQEQAVRRYVQGTLTLSELKQLAFDLAGVCTSMQGQELHLALADGKQCCIRAANVEARQKLEKWLAAAATSRLPA